MRILLGTIILAILAAGCIEAGPAGSGSPPAAEPHRAYEAAVLDGGTFNTSDHRGSVVVVNAWATWCAPCRDEMPGFQAWHERYADRGLVMVGVSVDDAGEDAGVRAFVDDLNVTYTIARDPARHVADVYNFVGLPQTMLLDRDGVLLKKWAPFDPLDAASSRAIEDALGNT